jgi:hypothetical protein
MAKPKLTEIGKRIEKIKKAEEKIKESRVITIEDALEDVPKLLNYLKEQYKGQLNVGSFSSEPSFKNSDTFFDEKVKIIDDGGNLIGTYTRRISIDDGEIIHQHYLGTFTLFNEYGQRKDENKGIPFP